MYLLAKLSDNVEDVIIVEHCYSCKFLWGGCMLVVFTSSCTIFAINGMCEMDI